MRQVVITHENLNTTNVKDLYCLTVVILVIHGILVTRVGLLCIEEVIHLIVGDINMAYGSTMRRATGNASNFSSNSGQYQSAYQNLETTIRRHQYTAAAPDEGSANALTSGNHFCVTICSFKRAFGSGNDSQPTATASNNYQSSSVMNGSSISNLSALIRLKNNAPETRYLDVYSVALSYYDALIWNTIFASQSPVTFDNSSVGPPELLGEVDWKIPTVGQVVNNTINNFKFLQHYIKKMGTITFGGVDSGTNTVEIPINHIPEKCRRSQTGMFYGYLFENDSDKNGSVTLNLSYDLDNSFEEAPSQFRLPYLY
uniref:Uncharacterized protein n=1 Tax=Diporeia sp. associated circular virus TaxID=1299317 RepID=M1T812_9VIRU|nr:hypothetical protein [Diporeia sp. associated circular virus]